MRPSPCPPRRPAAARPRPTFRPSAWRFNEPSPIVQNVPSLRPRAAPMTAGRVTGAREEAPAAESRLQDNLAPPAAPAPVRAGAGAGGGGGLRRAVRGARPRQHRRGRQHPLVPARLPRDGADAGRPRRAGHRPKGLSGSAIHKRRGGGDPARRSEPDAGRRLRRPGADRADRSRATQPISASASTIG